jgi:ATP-dependent helicase/nuclease subunit A
MLTVYKASAGSGKTFQLVAEYLKLLLVNPFNYRQILAVTFTNKATAEMKSRILEQLHILARNGDSPYLEWLKKEFLLEEDIVRQRAHQALNNILHDYSRFSISTIDSFTQRIIKSFNREMGISPHFVLELDNDLILEEAVDRLLARVDTDKQLRKWLVDYSREKIMENRSQRIEADIKQLGKELFKEKFQVFFPDTDETIYTRDNLNAFRKELAQIINWYENTLKKEGEKAVLLIKANGLQPDDFSGKGRGIGAFFEKLSYGEQPNITATVISHADSTDKWYTRTSDKKEVIHRLAESSLQPILKNVISFAQDNTVIYQSAIEVQKQLRILGILTDLKEEIKKLLQEKGILQLSDSNLLLSKIIGKSDSPFIYEKIGTRFNYFMIDEFQDTSLLQWRNFRPLVANALSEGHPALLVGDVKQSIYRWRNSDWNILASQINSDFPHFPPATVSLKKNWRSRNNIIAFNNAVVGALKNTFEEHLFNGFDDNRYIERFRSVYLEYLQEPGIKRPESDGKAEISFIDDDNFEEGSVQLMVEQVKRLQDCGLKPSDTAILIRKKSEGALIVEAFMEAAKQEENKGYNLSVLSNESLFLYASRGVNFVVLVMELLVNSEEIIQKTALLHLWLSWLKPIQEIDGIKTGNTADSGKAVAWLKGVEFDAFFEAELGKKIRMVQEEVSLYSLDETIMRICASFGLFDIKSELPYLQTLIDQAAEIKISLSNDLSNFLFWWKAKGCNTSVNVNEEVESIRLLTIHKAKGLEFEAVLLPFFNFDSSWVGNQAPVLWCGSDVEPFSRFPLLPVKAGSKLAGTVFSSDYFEEKMSSLIDSLNLVYVAFTRAKSVLFVNCKKPAERKNSDQGKTVNALLESSLDVLSLNEPFSGCWNLAKTVFSYGTIPLFQKTLKETSDNFLETYQFKDFNKRISLRLKSEEFLIPDTTGRSVKNTGKLVHEILASVQTAEDIEMACTKSVNEGNISIAERDEIVGILERSMKNPEIKQWFDGSYKILNERSLLTAERILRPDRIMIKGRNAVVADYKWGEVKQDKYTVQVRQYAEVLKKSGFEKVEGYIWYINLEKIEKVGEWQ